MQSDIQVSGGEIIFVNYIIQYRLQCSISKQCLVFAQHHLLGFYAAGQTHLADQPTGHCGQMNTVDERKYGLVLEKPRAAPWEQYHVYSKIQINFPCGKADKEACRIKLAQMTKSSV